LFAWGSFGREIRCSTGHTAAAWGVRAKSMPGASLFILQVLISHSRASNQSLQFFIDLSANAQAVFHATTLKLRKDDSEFRLGPTEPANRIFYAPRWHGSGK
jgi:hypothetical protein